ncbi:MAG: group II intron reverse transcriptase/maturase [Deltaproteobacteria bacterium]|nr:group II intron reverse transcriptase/maturase [Deltaproteobacteria bacterium]
MTMQEVASETNLDNAFHKVASNQGAPGPDGQGVATVRKHWDELRPVLRQRLLQGSYLPGDIRRVWIPKAGGGERGLGIPNVIDRIVQQAVYQVLSPNYEPRFHPSSHGFRPERSCHTAIAEARSHLQEGYEWVVDLDLAMFFDTVHHDRLMSSLARRISDRHLLKLLRRMLQANVVLPDGLVVPTTEGTPQGGPLSPLLSNIVLDELDWELEARGHRFVRYADDCNIYVRSEQSGQRVMAATTRFIESRLRLKVNQAKSAVAKPDTRHFLGFTLRQGSIGQPADVLLSQRSKDRAAAKIRELTPRTWGQPLRACIQRINAYLAGWLGYFRICTDRRECIKQLGSWDAHIRRRLRAIQLKQWKRKPTIVRRLTALGAPEPAARAAVYGQTRSIWNLSHTYAVEQGAMSPQWFATQGLISLAESWRASGKPVTVSERKKRKPKKLRAQAGAKQQELFLPPGVPKSRM